MHTIFKLIFSDIVLLLSLAWIFHQIILKFHIFNNIHIEKLNVPLAVLVKLLVYSSNGISFKLLSNFFLWGFFYKPKLKLSWNFDNFFLSQWNTSKTTNWPCMALSCFGINSDLCWLGLERVLIRQIQFFEIIFYLTWLVTMNYDFSSYIW